MATITLREATFLAIKAALVAGFPAAAIERNRRSDIAPGEALPRLILRDGGHRTAQDTVLGEALMTLSLEVEGHVTAATDEAVGTAINTLHAALVTALTAAPLALGGGGAQAWLMEQGTEIDIAPAAGSTTPAGRFAATFSAELDAPLSSGPYTTT